MLMFHSYTWHEAIPAREELDGSNIRKKRVTIDVLLPGPTALSQTRANVSQDGKEVHLTYSPPSTYLSADRTAVRITGETLGTVASDDRVEAHCRYLEQVRVDQSEKVQHIPLPFECERHFCRRDDWGRDYDTVGLIIGRYRHDDPDLILHNQNVWILHVECAAQEVAMATPMSPGEYGDYSTHA